VKRSIFDTLKRGFDDNVANWPLIAIRVAQMVLVFALVIGGVLAIVVPLLLSIGIRVAALNSPEAIQDAVGSLLHNWLLFVWIFAGMLLLFVILVAVAAFVEAGCARVYVDAERAAGPAMSGLRARFRVFTMERFLSGATSGWWPVFWIYNIVWSVAAMILLVPLAVIAVLMFITSGNQPAMVILGCGGLLFVFLIAVPIAVVSGMWANRAVVQWTAQRVSTNDAISAAWRAIRQDLGRHVGIAFAMLIIAFAASSVASSFSFMAAFGQIAGRHNPLIPMAMLPLRVFTQFLSVVASAAVTSWYVASYAALAVEGTR
jgi:hypothetical protein